MRRRQERAEGPHHGRLLAAGGPMAPGDAQSGAPRAGRPRKDNTGHIKHCDRPQA